MKLTRLTATFGVLNNQTLTLGSGLHLIYAPNESGKTTWCAFLRAMLYGLPTRDRRPASSDLRDPAAALPRLGTGEWRSRFRLLPYRSVGVDRGLLLAVRVDSLELDGRGRGPVLVALSPTPVSDGGGYQALVGAM